MRGKIIANCRKYINELRKKVGEEKKEDLEWLVEHADFYAGSPEKDTKVNQVHQTLENFVNVQPNNQHNTIPEIFQFNVGNTTTTEELYINFDDDGTG